MSWDGTIKHAAVAEEIRRITAICYTKHRNILGMVGVVVEKPPSAALARVRVRGAYEWKDAVDSMPQIPATVSMMYQKAGGWHRTLIEQETGDYLITALRGFGLPMQVINTSKKITDPKDIRRVKKMDRVEMTEYLAYLKQSRRVLFPPKEKQSKFMRELEEQLPFWSRHVTEAGSTDYYTPGEEPDHMVRSLMVCCHAARPWLGTGRRMKPRAVPMASGRRAKPWRRGREDLGTGLTGSQYPTGGGAHVVWPS